MDRTRQFICKDSIHGPLTCDSALPLESRRHERQIEMALAPCLGIHPAVVMVSGMLPAVILERDRHRIERCCQFFEDNRPDWAL